MAKKYVGTKPLELDICGKVYNVNYSSSKSLGCLEHISQLGRVDNEIALVGQVEEITELFLDTVLGEGSYDEIYAKVCSITECVKILGFIFDSISEHIDGAVNEYID